MAGTTGSSGRGRPRKPAVGSRTPTSRPRTVAGRSAPVPDVETADVESSDVDPSQADSPGVSLLKSPAPDAESPKVEQAKPAAPDVEPAERSGASRRGRSPKSSRSAPSGLAPSGHGVTTVLAVLIVLLLGVGTWELVTLLGDDESSSSTTITADRPVRVDPLTVSSVVDQARMASEVILSASSDDYDGQVDKATAMMTTTFAQQYRETKAQIKDRFVAAQTTVTVDVSAQGVVSASPSEIVAMVFLTQSTTMRRTDLKVAQYRVRVTMLRDGDTWLVSQLDTI